MSLSDRQFAKYGLRRIPDDMFHEVQPLSLPEIMGELPPREQVTKKGVRNREFDPKRLTTTQTEYSVQGLKKHSSGPAVTARLGGVDYLVDGHHRAIDAALKGRKVPSVHYDIDRNPRNLDKAMEHAGQEHGRP